MSKMKTAEDWIKHIWWSNPTEQIEAVQAIQLDAAKAAMEYAARIDCAGANHIRDMRQAILTASQNPELLKEMMR